MVKALDEGETRRAAKTGLIDHLSVYIDRALIASTETLAAQF